MRPPRNCNPAPFRHYGWMTPFGFCDLSDLVCELKSFHEVAETVGSLKTFDSVSLCDQPQGNLRMKLGDFRVGEGGFSSSTGRALHLYKFHVTKPDTFRRYLDGSKRQSIRLHTGSRVQSGVLGLSSHTRRSRLFETVRARLLHAEVAKG